MFKKEQILISSTQIGVQGQALGYGALSFYCFYFFLGGGAITLFHFYRNGCDTFWGCGNSTLTSEKKAVGFYSASLDHRLFDPSLIRVNSSTPTLDVILLSLQSRTMFEQHMIYVCFISNQ
jgi:hypothetical protein